MQIKVTLADGTTNLYPVSANSVITVKEPAPNDSTPGAELSFAFQGATAVELVADPEPVEAPVDEHVEVILTSDTGDPAVAATPEDSPPVEMDPVTIDPAQFSGGIDVTLPTEPPADPATDSVEPTPEPDPVHDTAVTEANDAIVAVALGTSDPGSLAKALADVEAALAQYPDSTELADAKTQLTELSADNTPPAAA